MIQFNTTFLKEVIQQMFINPYSRIIEMKQMIAKLHEKGFRVINGRCLQPYV